MSDTSLTPPHAAAPPSASRLERWRPRVEYQGLSLAAVCALVALSLLVGDRLTHRQIAAQQVEDRLVVLRQVLPAALYDNNPLQEAFKVEDRELGEVEVYPARKGDLLTAVAFQVSNIGYGGPIRQLIALDAEGRILGVRVLGHKETPGLADKIEASRSDWIKAFDGLSLASTPLAQWKVKKDGGQFDQFAGATITPRAVVKSVLQALQFQARQAGLLGAPQTEAQP
ncbi:electron transport complex subunit RsxG [Pseudomonas sp. MAP12]|uniref:Ion-translocating oxidoreductase complex subunit G n=1 Tax=Geopseudomonas aromaticivorans TaxID=2849492 RepID=A0ABS6MXR6_9GAMM|nr:electron transport complex subunit RsxG [Pseudomonas aromaticivorans]MBV2133121.1 electron transport complex subunit RsxG [Pseudomonas aromaticivorans]